MRCLIDAQLPPSLARWLVGQGHDATHVVDHAMAQAFDEVIWDFAIGIGAVIITKDEDFAARRTRSGVGPAVVWLRFPNQREADLLARIQSVLPAIRLALDRGETLIEIV